MAQFLARAKRCTPSAWMMLITVPNCVLNPVPNRVLSVGHFIRAQMGHFSLAPRSDLHVRRDIRTPCGGFHDPPRRVGDASHGVSRETPDHSLKALIVSINLEFRHPHVVRILFQVSEPHVPVFPIDVSCGLHIRILELNAAHFNRAGSASVSRSRTASASEVSAGALIASLQTRKAIQHNTVCLTPVSGGLASRRSICLTC